MKNLSAFQLILTAAFIVFIVAGVLLFAGFGGFGNSNAIGPVTLWGTYDRETMDGVIDALSESDPRFEEVTYVEKDPRTFDTELINALAAGRGPDIFFLKQDAALEFEDKITPIPFSVISERTYKDAFVEEGELFLRSGGVLAMPLTLDPLILYWNRDHYADAGVAQVPRFWDEVLTLALDGSLTLRGETGAILQSAFALGGYQNIAHAKELLSMLMIQAGNQLVVSREGGAFVSSLRDSAAGQTPSENALRFYTDFSNPSKSTYSWNSALPEAQLSFVAGTLSNYIGFASEIRSIRAQNANLNFDIALVPQVRTGARSATFGTMVGLAVPKGAQNPNGAVQIAIALTGDAALKLVSDATGLAPTSRALLSERPSDPFKVIVRDAALQSRAWFDPDPGETERVFKNMIESVASGRLRVSEAIGVADQELSNLLQ